MTSNGGRPGVRWHTRRGDLAAWQQGNCRYSPTTRSKHCPSTPSRTDTGPFTCHSKMHAGVTEAVAERATKYRYFTPRHVMSALRHFW